MIFESSDPHDNLLLQCTARLGYLYKWLTFRPIGLHQSHSVNAGSDEGLRAEMSAVYINIPILQCSEEEDCHEDHSTRILFIQSSEGQYTECCPCWPPLESHTVPVMKWWLLCHCIHGCEAWFHLPAYEILISKIVFYQDRSENDARRSNCSLLALPHTTHRSPGILELPQLTPEMSLTLNCYAISRGWPSTFSMYLQNQLIGTVY